MNVLLDYYRQKWDEIHTNATNAKTPEKRVEYCTWLRHTIGTIYCHMCRAHAVAYLQAYPPENKEDLFHWTWEFHNNVNSRLHKPIMDYNTASTKYLGWTS
jgi:hypothetical protein